MLWQFRVARNCSDLGKEATAALPLCKGNFILKDGERLLQACNLVCAGLLTLLVSLWLCDALALDLGIVVVHCIELSLRRLAITACLCNALVKSDKLLCLVLDILHL